MFGNKKDLGSILKGFMITIKDLDDLVTSKDDEISVIADKMEQLESDTNAAVAVMSKAKSVSSKLKDIVGD